MSFGDRITQLAREDPDAIAAVVLDPAGGATSLRRAELDRRSSQVARALQRDGAGLGARVALALQNSPELLIAVLGCWKAGAIPVPVRWDLPAWEQQRVLDVLEPAVVLGEGAAAWFDAAGELDGGPLPVAVSPQTHGICSSGSTGTPKVILAERPAVFDPETTGLPFPASWGEIARPQVVLVPTQLYHTNGFATLFNLLAGDQLLLMTRFDAAALVDAVERYRVTTFTATPTMLQRVADLPGIDERDLSSVVWVLQGAAVIPPSLVHRWLGLLGPERFFMAYGMTEGLGLTAIRGDEWLAHPGSVGRGYRDTEIRIVGPDGTEVAPGELGEIYLRSPTSGLYRYLGGAARLTTTEDGFGTAGDIGSIDEEGYLTIVDRRVDLIVTGGANVYPAEVETALIDHPAIADVVVIGLTDPEWGRRVHAIVEPTDPADPPSAEDVIAFAKARLASYKAPKSVEFVDTIPRTAATKVSRAELIAARGG